jgi:hypothetical protein
MKQFIKVLLSLVTVALIIFMVTSCVTEPAVEEEFTVGDPGPAGGIIFYDDEADGVDDIVGYRYLEAASVSTEWVDKVWGGYGTLVGGTLTALGTGAANTEKIVTKYGVAEPYANKTDYAAKLCSDLEYGGYDDWFLPSKDELNLVYLNLHKEGLGGFTSYSSYWNSSEYNTNFAWDQYFVIGALGDDDKSSAGRVRAVRVF